MVRALGACTASRVLVIDDNSPDGTGELADRLAAELGYVDVLHRERKEGLGPAYLAGFRRALADGAELILEMDCDFSHDPADVPRLIAAAEEGADLVLGSRYVPGGGDPATGASSGASISRGGSLYAQRPASGCACATSPAASSATAARCSRRSTSTRSTRRATRSRSRRPTAPLRAGFRVVEVPITFVDREHGRLEDEPRDRARGGLEGAARCGSRRSAAGCSATVAGMREVDRRDLRAPRCSRPSGPSSSTSGRRGAGRAGRSSRSSAELEAEHGERVGFAKLNIDAGLADRRAATACSRSRPRSCSTTAARRRRSSAPGRASYYEQRLRAPGSAPSSA